MRNRMSIDSVPEKWRWFPESRFGMFIHWGAYAAYGRGEQVLFREHLDQKEYGEAACRWNPQQYDAAAWAHTAKRAGMKYAVLTTRHHDGFCLWDSKYTDYSVGKQAPKRDFVREFADAFRAAGLRVGLYYSLADWRIPAYWEGPENDPEGWEGFRTYVHNQVEELLTDYGKIDIMWFDGAWPQNAVEWRGPELVEKMRALQPDLLINNRLGSIPAPAGEHVDGGAGPGTSELGDFGTPEHRIAADPGRLWESCQVSTWRLWGYTIGERWRPPEQLLDMLVQAASMGGNLLLNVGPDGDGRLPAAFGTQAEAIGRWMETHGEVIYGSEGGDVCEMITRGYQVVKGNKLYLVIRYWDRRPELRLAGLATGVKRAKLLTTEQELEVEQNGDVLLLKGLPAEQPTSLFPVIEIECEDVPKASDWAVDRLWGGDPRRMTGWAGERGQSVWADGEER
jgi:alpha-L-fucosidase